MNKIKCPILVLFMLIFNLSNAEVTTGTQSYRPDCNPIINEISTLYKACWDGTLSVSDKPMHNVNMSYKRFQDSKYQDWNLQSVNSDIDDFKNRLDKNLKEYPVKPEKNASCQATYLKLEELKKCVKLQK